MFWSCCLLGSNSKAAEIRCLPKLGSNPQHEPQEIFNLLIEDIYP